MTWLKSLFAALLGGAATGGAVYLQSNGQPDIQAAGVAAAVGALASVAGYLKQSPVQVTK